MCLVRVTVKLHTDDNVDKSEVYRITENSSHYSYKRKLQMLLNKTILKISEIYYIIFYYIMLYLLYYVFKIVLNVCYYPWQIYLLYNYKVSAMIKKVSYIIITFLRPELIKPRTTENELKKTSRQIFGNTRISSMYNDNRRHAY